MPKASSLLLRTLPSRISLKGRRVLLRVDWNDPAIYRISRSRETIDVLRRSGARVIILAYRGRPHGHVDPRLSLRGVATQARKILGIPLTFIPETIGPDVEAAIARLKPGGCLLLENIRFHPGEEANDPKFARSLAELGDCYINDAFSASHRNHASVNAITHFISSYAGTLLNQEVTALSRIRDHARHPFVAIIGGSKLSTKVTVMQQLLKHVDVLCVGGGMANELLAAQGLPIGQSRIEKSLEPIAKKLLRNPRLVMPVDVLVSRSTAKPVEVRTLRVDQLQTDIHDDDFIVDLGPNTVQRYTSLFTNAKTIVWNGPLGIYEVRAFQQSTLSLAQSMEHAKAYSVVGGGETVDAVLLHPKAAKHISFISTGGGAMIEFLEGRMLPGIKPLMRSKN